MKRLGIALVLLTVSLGWSRPARAQLFRVLVTNDDGVGAAGISAVVDELRLNPNLEVTVIAPAANQSGTGDGITTAGSLDVTAATTAGGVPATSVSGLPADTVLFAVRTELPALPNAVVSGINFGQNITREIVGVSGTVGAALTAARLGIPAIAVSQGLGAGIDYGPAARYVANVVEDLRAKSRLGKKMTSRNGLDQRMVLNVNFPTCTAGAVRGVKVVPLAQRTTVTGYTLLSDDGTTRTYEPVVQNANFLLSNCTSTLEDPSTDLEAMQNGFASVTVLNPDLTVDSKLRRFRFLERFDFE